MAMDFRPVVVVGGTGFVGQEVVKELFYSGQRVRVVSRHPRLPGEVEDGDPVEAVEADLTDAESLKPALDGARAVINAVSLYHETRGLDFRRIHVDGAARLAKLAKEAGVEQYVLMSGIGADAASPSPYVRARAQGEQAVVEEMARAVILRPSALYGPQGGLLATLARLARLPVIPLFGQGNSRLQPLHVGDLAAAIARLTARPATPRALFEFGGPDALSYRALVSLVARHLGRDPRLVSVPMAVWHTLAMGLSPLPSPPLTRDMLWLVGRDNLVGDGVGTFADIGITPRSVRESLPHCLPR